MVRRLAERRYETTATANDAKATDLGYGSSVSCGRGSHDICQLTVSRSSLVLDYIPTPVSQARCRVTDLSVLMPFLHTRPTLTNCIACKIDVSSTETRASSQAKSGSLLYSQVDPKHEICNNVLTTNGHRVSNHINASKPAIGLPLPLTIL